MGNLRGLPNGFEYCGCDDCCPKRKEGEKLPPEPTKKEKCVEGRPNCYCELFYRRTAGSYQHRRYLALPKASGKFEPADNEEYDYYCVQPAFDPETLPGTGKYLEVCGDPVTVKDKTDPMGSNVEFTCPGGCTGGTCHLFYLKGGEDGYKNRWKPVEAGSKALDKKFSENSSGRLIIDPKDLKELQTRFRFKCFCFK